MYRQISVITSETIGYKFWNIKGQVTDIHVSITVRIRVDSVEVRLGVACHRSDRLECRSRE